MSSALEQPHSDSEYAPTRRRSKPRAPRYSALTPVIVLLTLATAAGRAYLGREFVTEGLGGGNGLDFAYFAEGLGFLVLLVGLYAPLPFLPRDRLGVRFLLGVYALATLAAYLVIESAGRWTAVGLATVALDLLLIGALILEARRISPLGDEDLAVRHA